MAYDACRICVCALANLTRLDFLAGAFRQIPPVLRFCVEEFLIAPLVTRV